MINSLASMTGTFAILFLGSITSWRNASLVGFALPIVTILLMVFVSLQVPILENKSYKKTTHISDPRVTPMANRAESLRGCSEIAALVAGLDIGQSGVLGT